MGVFICSVKSLEVEQSKVLVMVCHWHSGLITGHDDRITLVGVRVLHCRNILQNRVVFMFQ